MGFQPMWGGTIKSMPADSPTIGDFIDAVFVDPEKAADMLARDPSLRNARWIHQETALHFLAIEGDAAHVRLLCEWGFDPNAVNEFGDAPLIDVATLGRADVAEVLLEFGADPNATSETSENALHCAARSGNAPLVQMLLHAGARADYLTEIGETVWDALAESLEKRAAIEAVLSAQGIARDEAP